MPLSLCIQTTKEDIITVAIVGAGVIIMVENLMKGEVTIINNIREIDGMMTLNNIRDNMAIITGITITKAIGMMNVGEMTTVIKAHPLPRM